jgi:hypothetical protein
MSPVRSTAVVADTLGSVVDRNSGLANRKVNSIEPVVSGVVPRDDDVGGELKRKSSDGSVVTEGEAAEERGVKAADSEELFSGAGVNNVSEGVVFLGASV